MKRTGRNRRGSVLVNVLLFFALLIIGIVLAGRWVQRKIDETDIAVTKESRQSGILLGEKSFSTNVEKKEGLKRFNKKANWTEKTEGDNEERQGIADPAPVHEDPIEDVLLLN